jgi:chemotaxis protein MotB
MDDDFIQEPEPPSMAWLLTFADLVSLLITFFVLLFSMKNVDESQWDALVGELQGIFAVQKAVFDTRPTSEHTIEKVDLSEADNLTYLQNLLKTRFNTDPVLSAVTSSRDQKLNRLNIIVPSALLFQSGSSALNAQGEKAMRNLADILRHLDNRVEIAGHTDPIPIYTSTYPTNWELAMMRSITVAQIMEKRGVPGPVPAVSYADSRIHEVPVEGGLLERNDKARRVEIIVHGTQ